MECKVKKQQGYLLVLAVILITIVSFVGNLLVYMFMGRAGGSVQNNLKSNAALYIALSGLEHLKQEFITVIGIGSFPILMYNNNELMRFCLDNDRSKECKSDNLDCESYNTYNFAKTNLQSEINATDLSLSLTDITGFTDSGIISIDNELITYAGINNNKLRVVTRGALGTAAATHNVKNAQVIQSQCTINAIGAIPSLKDPVGKRGVKQSLLGCAGFYYGGLFPAMVSFDKVSLSNNILVVNPTVTKDSKNFSGSTIVAGKSIHITGLAGTEVGGVNGGLVKSSDSNSQGQDIVVYRHLDKNFFMIFSGDSIAKYVKNDSDIIIGDGKHPIAELNDLSGFGSNVSVAKTIWVEGGIDANKDQAVTLGTVSEPVTLVINGDAKFTGNSSLTVNGIVYIHGSITTGDNASITVNGQIVAKGDIDMKGKGVVTFNPVILSAIAKNKAMLFSCIVNLASPIQEVFPVTIKNS